MISQHYPALQVVLPLLAAPICVLFRNTTAAWLLSLAVSILCLAISIALLGQTIESGPISYDMGGWAEPWGIELRVDTTNAFVLIIVSVIGAAVLAFSRASVLAEIAEKSGYLFFSMIMLNFCGMLGIAITGDAFNLFVFLEISSLSSYVLIAMASDRRALHAAYQYLIMGTIGATFYLIGVGFLYMMTGTLNMVDLAQRLPGVADTRTVHMAIAFILIGMGLKAAIFPLHLWLPNAYTFAPSAVTAFLAATSTKVSVYVLLRMFFTVFGLDFSFAAIPLDTLLFVLAALGMVIASTVAIFQADAKRLLAYSSIAQIGYMILGISFASAAGLTATIVHLFNHALIKGGLFMVLACVALRLRSTLVADLSGIGRAMPWTMGAFVVGGLSLIGVPLTTGFVSKWALVQAAMADGHWLAAVLIVFASLLAIAYVWRIVEVAYFTEPSPEAEAVREAPLSMLVPTWFLILTNVYFGIDTDATLDTAMVAARSLMGTLP